MCQRIGFPPISTIGFGHQLVDVVHVELLAHQGQLDDFGIVPFGEVAGDVGRLQAADLAGDPLHDLVDAHRLPHDAFQVVVEGMPIVGLVKPLLPLVLGGEQSRLREAVQLHPDGVGRFVELLLHHPQVTAVAIEEEKLN